MREAEMMREATSAGTKRPAIRVVDPTKEATWDERLGQFEEATYFHSASWTRVLAETYGFRPCSLLAEENGKVLGALPLMEVDNWPRGRRGVSLPFTDECAALGDEEGLLKAAIAEGQRRGWKYLEFRAGSDLLEDVEPSLAFYGHHLDLERGEEDIIKGFDPAVQRAIRKAEREGVTVEIGTTLDAVRTYYALHGKTRRKHGVPPQSYRFFETIHRRALGAGKGFVAIARCSGTAIAGAVFFHHGRNAIYKFGGSDERFQELRGNNLVMWAAIRCLKNRGCRRLDFGRTPMANEGLRRFKSAWGTKETRVDYHKYDFSRSQFVKDRDRASGWQTLLMRFLPGPTFGWAGALLYRRLA